MYIVGFSVGAVLLIASIICFVFAPLFPAIALLIAAISALAPACVFVALQVVNNKKIPALERERDELVGHLNTQTEKVTAAEMKLIRNTLEVIRFESDKYKREKVDLEATLSAGEDSTSALLEDTVDIDVEIEKSSYAWEAIRLEQSHLESIQEKQNKEAGKIRALERKVEGVGCEFCGKITGSILFYVAGGILLIAASICLAVVPFLIALPILISAMLGIGAGCVLMADCITQDNMAGIRSVRAPTLRRELNISTESLNAALRELNDKIEQLETAQREMKIAQRKVDAMPAQPAAPEPYRLPLQSIGFDHSLESETKE